MNQSRILAESQFRLLTVYSAPMRLLKLGILLASCLWLGLGTGWTAVALAADEAAEKERISKVAQETLVEVQTRIKAANKLGYEARELALDELMHEVIAPLVHNPATMADFYGEHWAEIERQGLQKRALDAALTLLKENYMFVIERVDRAKVQLLRVVVYDSKEASAFFRIQLRKRIPVEVELRSNDQQQWRIHDLVLLRRSVRTEVSTALQQDIEEVGARQAFDNILAPE